MSYFICLSMINLGQSTFFPPSRYGTLLKNYPNVLKKYPPLELTHCQKGWGGWMSAGKLLGQNSVGRNITCTVLLVIHDDPQRPEYIGNSLAFLKQKSKYMTRLHTRAGFNFPGKRTHQPSFTPELVSLKLNCRCCLMWLFYSCLFIHIYVTQYLIILR